MRQSNGEETEVQSEPRDIYVHKNMFIHKCDIYTKLVSTVIPKDEERETNLGQIKR